MVVVVGGGGGAVITCIARDEAITPSFALAFYPLVFGSRGERKTQECDDNSGEFEDGQMNGHVNLWILGRGGCTMEERQEGRFFTERAKLGAEGGGAWRLMTDRIHTSTDGSMDISRSRQRYRQEGQPVRR